MNQFYLDHSLGDRGRTVKKLTDNQDKQPRMWVYLQLSTFYVICIISYASLNTLPEQIISHIGCTRLLDFSPLCWWTDSHTQLSMTLVNKCQRLDWIDMWHYLINTWHPVSKHTTSIFVWSSGSSSCGTLNQNIKVASAKTMSWDAVVVTCPKQSWVSSIREEVAIALNQVMMMMRKRRMRNKLNMMIYI